MLKYFIILTLLLFSSNVIAEEYDNKVPMEYEGRPGAWIEENTLNSMVQDLSEYNRLKYKVVPDLELKIFKQEHEIKIAEKELEVTEQISDIYKSMFEESEALRIEETKFLRQELRNKNAWYKSPAFLFSLGIIVGGALAVGMAYGIDQAS